MFNYLIDYRNKKNNRIVLDSIQKEIDKLNLTFEEIEEIKDLNNAYGKSLDLYGESLGIKRGNYSDETYRLVIKGFILALRSRGTLNDLAIIISRLLDVELSEIVIDELYDDFREKAFSFSDELITDSKTGFSDIKGVNGGHLEKLSSERESAVIEISKIPLDKLLELGVTTDDFISIVNTAVSAGVRLNKVELSGTFEFSDTLVENSDSGFNNGNLGAIYGKESI